MFVPVAVLFLAEIKDDEKKTETRESAFSLRFNVKMSKFMDILFTFEPFKHSECKLICLFDDAHVRSSQIYNDTRHFEVMQADKHFT